MEKKELAERIVEYASNYHWNLEGWGDNVPEDDDLEKELTGIVTFVFEELDKAREEGRRKPDNTVGGCKSLPLVSIGGKV